jgi:membrane protein CcdC involved in cytochrome C biogenesis
VLESLPHFKLILLAVSIAGAVIVLSFRLRESRGLVTGRKILIPPLGMSTGFIMFVYPPTRVPLPWAVAALAVGALVLHYPLARSSRLTRVGAEVRMERSPAFLWILVGLVAVRFALRSWVERQVSPLQTGAIFFLLAFGMIARWRIEMWHDYRQLLLVSPPPASDTVAPPQ